MASGTYAAGLKQAVETDPSLLPLVDEAVGRVLAAKARAGLCASADRPPRRPGPGQGHRPRSRRGRGAAVRFGHGLSYTRLDYSARSFDRAEIGPDGQVAMSVSVTNCGIRTAGDVVKPCIRDPLAPVARPVAELRGFVRVSIGPEATRRLTFRLAAAQTALWSRDGWVVEPGRIDVMVAPRPRTFARLEVHDYRRRPQRPLRRCTRNGGDDRLTAQLSRLSRFS